MLCLQLFTVILYNIKDLKSSQFLGGTKGEAPVCPLTTPIAYDTLVTWRLSREDIYVLLSTAVQQGSKGTGAVMCCRDVCLSLKRMNTELMWGFAFSLPWTLYTVCSKLDHGKSLWLWHIGKINSLFCDWERSHTEGKFGYSVGGRQDRLSC